MEAEKLKHFTIEILETHKRVIKPWKKSTHVDNEWTQDYAQGWNDCLKEMEKQHRIFMKVPQMVFSPHKPSQIL